MTLQGYFTALPKPVWTDNDIDVAQKVVREPSSLIWNTWKEDTIKIAVLRAIVSCRVRLTDVQSFDFCITSALAQKPVRSLPIHWKWRKWITSSSQVSPTPDGIFLSLSKHPDFWKPSASIAPGDNHESSECWPKFVSTSGGELDPFLVQDTRFAYVLALR